MKGFFVRFLGISALVVSGIGLQPAHAALTVTDANSTIIVDPSSTAGMNSWTVDGVQQLFQQWFWYRIGTTGGQAGINTISATPTTSAVGPLIMIHYTSATLDVDVRYLLTGGTAGSHTSDVGETITLRNLGTTAMDLHFFQYSDFDLNGQILGQTVSYPNANAVDQFGNGIIASETTITPTASRFQAAYWPSLLNSINSSTTYDLNNTNTANTAGGGDATWAFQWDFNIGAGGSVQISKDKNLHASPVPEPSSLLLFGTCLAIVGTLLRRKVANL